MLSMVGLTFVTLGLKLELVQSFPQISLLFVLYIQGPEITDHRLHELRWTISPLKCHKGLAKLLVWLT